MEPETRATVHVRLPPDAHLIHVTIPTPQEDPMPSAVYNEDDHARYAALADARDLTGSHDEDTLIRVANYILTGEHRMFDTPDTTTILEGGGVQGISLADQIGGTSYTGKVGVNIPAPSWPAEPTEEEIQRYAAQIDNALHPALQTDEATLEKTLTKLRDQETGHTYADAARDQAAERGDIPTEGGQA